MSTQITFKKFTTWLFINYKVINVITGKSASPKDFDILDFVEPRRRRYQSLLEYIHMKIEFYSRMHITMYLVHVNNILFS